MTDSGSTNAAPAAQAEDPRSAGHHRDLSRPGHSVVRAFEQAAVRSPEALAVVGADGELDYAALNDRANRLAHELIAAGIGPECYVGILLPRDTRTAVALLAILKAGAAYLPLDPASPPARIAAIVGDVRPALVFTVPELAAKLPEALVRLFDADPGSGTGPAADPTDADRTTPLLADHPAYAIFTSGSTGRPKGVVIPCKAYLNLLEDMAETFGLTPADRVLAVANLAFDMSCPDLLLPLRTGAAAIIAPGDAVRDPGRLADLMLGHGVTLMQATPSLWHGVVTERPEALNRVRVLIGGEALPTALAERLLQTCAGVTNLYGPTEATVWSTLAAVPPDLNPAERPHIGHPIRNTTLHVLDADLCPVPDGTEGELYIGGTGLARGYLNRPGLTASRFVAFPYGPAGARLYRTGDIVRTRPDGALDYLGRVDHQIKVNGYRVEPGEIQARLEEHPDVERAAVIARAVPGGSFLAAYVTSAGESPNLPDLPERLRSHLAEQLPAYMVPAAVLVLDALPLNQNGKVDIKALPEPRMTLGAGGAPTGAVQTMVYDLFAELLALRDFGVDESLFALGGSSLTATRLIGCIRAEMGVALDIDAVFAAPTVAGLAERLANTTNSDGPLLAAAPRPEHLELSAAQRGLWFLNKLRRSADYNIPMAVRLRGELDPVALETALGDLVRRHEPLRTVFPDSEGHPCQRVLDPDAVAIRLTPLACPEGDLDAVCHAAATTPFDLATEIPLRAHLLTVGRRDHVLLLVVHHIAADGWSHEVILRDLGTAYTARRGLRAPDWQPLPVHYSDFTRWQHETLGDSADPATRLARGLAHWRTALAGLPDELPMPTDRRRPSAPVGRGAAVLVELPADLHRELAGLARDTGTTLFMVLQAALAALLTRFGAGTDLPIGGVTAGRIDSRLDDVVGLFVNTLVFRVDTAGDPSFRDLLTRVRDGAVTAYKYQEVPFDRLVEDLKPARNPARHPLFQTMFVLHEAAPAANGFVDLDGVHLPVPTGDAKFDLNLELTERRDSLRAPQGLRGHLRYATDLYDGATVADLVDRFVRVLRSAVADPDVSLSGLDLLAPGEDRELASLGRTTTPPVASDATVHGLFSEQARRTPGAVALWFEDVSVTYRELDARSDRLARRLAGAGIGRGDIVGVHIPRGVLMVEAMLAVLKSGAAYAVLDVDFPAARLDAMAGLVRPRCVLVGGRRPWPGKRVVDVVDLDDDTALIDAGSAGSTGRLIGADDRACVMFTSGSSGQPKAVVSPHRAVVGSFAGARYSGFGPGEVYLQSAPVSWDVFARQLFGPLLNGGAVVLQPGQRPEPALIAELAARHGVTVLDAAGSLFNHLWDEYPEVFATLRWAISGGEAASAAHLAAVAAAYPDIRVVNGYGPVESLGHTTAFRADAGWSTASVPIGRPLPGKSVYVLDDRLRPVPPGVPGELYAAGTGLAHGYATRPGGTAERFVADPFGPPGSRMYRTGDLARRAADGVTEYLGRVDDQVKVRGFRIEPAEIRAVLGEHPGVRQAEVVIREDRPGDQRIVAYVIGRGESADTGSGSGSTSADLVRQLRSYATARLPQHMVPAAYVVIAEFPRTANGKLDRQMLPAPDAAATAAASGRSPRTPQEEILCELFAECLSVPRVSIDDDFFALGGHSLLAMRLISRIRTVCRVELTVAAVFAAPTVAAFVDQLALARPARPALRSRSKEKL